MILEWHNANTHQVNGAALWAARSSLCVAREIASRSLDVGVGAAALVVVVVVVVVSACVVVVVVGAGVVVVDDDWAVDEEVEEEVLSVDSVVELEEGASLSVGVGGGWGGVVVATGGAA